ncbi:MAG: PSD1 and planctomycete cytochrome C domain-containing protein [Pirellulales bacterium]
MYILSVGSLVPVPQLSKAMRDRFVYQIAAGRPNGSQLALTNFIRMLLCWTVIFALLATCVAGEITAEEIDFNRDIRPILSGACYPCHGPDASHREADLRLDTQQGALDGATIVPGKPQASELLRRILTEDADERMPPPEAGEKLTDGQIALLRRWIEQGARWSTHWAFTAPTRPIQPDTRNSNWPHNPIDTFVLARLQAQQLQPSVEAERTILLRRLSLDLIGLPPTLEEIDTFLRDQRPDAYRRQVERLIASPHYGERWGRIWLDAARYADSDGFEKDKPRDVWFYRDWVINAINGDMPYDRFLIEQIAGDLLPDATQAQRVATGFLRNSMINEEGGIDPEQFRMEAMFDRMDAIGSGILGLTVRCGQCHSHKYDPLTQREYYRMFAFLNNCHEGQMRVYTPGDQEQRENIITAIDQIELQLQQKDPGWIQRMAIWEKQQVQTRQMGAHVAQLEFDETSIGGQKFLPQADGSYLAQGYAPTKFQPRMRVKNPPRKISAMRLELMTDHNLPGGGPGRSLWGTCALSEVKVQIVHSAGQEPTTNIKIKTAVADLSLPPQPLASIYDDKKKEKRITGPIEFAIDGRLETAWELDAGPGQRNQAHQAIFTFEKPIDCPPGAELWITLAQMHGGWNSDDRQTNNLGRFRIAFIDTHAPSSRPLPPAISQLLMTGAEERTHAHTARLFSHWRTTEPQWQIANQQIENLWQDYPAGTSQLVLTERHESRPTYQLERGNFLNPQEEVVPGVPAFLHDLSGKNGLSDKGGSDESPNRLTFARWLADRRSPTTARAIVNRLWQAYFGIGLVATPSDLGSQGEPPSHPLLLDWLAVELMDHDWSLKHLHRLIVTSATYRQSSDMGPDLLARDPDNRLLARGARFRVDAELVRDIALAVSGLLNDQIGGPSVYPIAPAFLFQRPASYGPKVWDTEPGANGYRRALYTFFYRSVPFPSLQTFDAPPADSSCVRRFRSNTPLQALTTLNEPLFVRCAQMLALRTVRDGGTHQEDRLEYAFRHCTSRPPVAKEKAVLLAFYDQQEDRFTESSLDPWKFAVAEGVQIPELPSGTSPAQLAAWTAVSRVLLNLDETISKE